MFSVKDDMRDIIREYLKNNVNVSMLDEQKKRAPKPNAEFDEDKFVLSRECLLDLKQARKHHAEFMDQKKREPQILADILNNIKKFVESGDIVHGAKYIKEQYGLKNKHEITKKMRELMYKSI